RTWETLKSVMAPGALDPLTKEMIYLAVSATNGCRYCIASHTASARGRGMTEAMLGELMAVVGMANETNSLADGYQSESDALARVAPRERVVSLPHPNATSSQRGEIAMTARRPLPTLRLVLVLALLVASSMPAPVAAQTRSAAPAGEMTWGVHVSLAPVWFD